MLSRRLFTCILLVSLACTPFVSAAAAKPKILYITTTAGFHHSACEYSVPVIKKMAQESGAFDVVCSAKTDLITRESLKQFAAVCFSNTTGDLKQFPLTEENRNAFMDAIKGGMAFIGIHAATDTYKDWKPYYEMINGSFIAHPWNEKIAINMEDPSHPSAVMLPEMWTIKDEIYTFKNYARANCHVIMSMAKESEKGKGNREDGDYALAWSKMYGKGRVFYTALGHEHALWDNPLFQQHLMGGILWALGKKKANLSLGHSKVAGKWQRIFDGKTIKWGTDWEATENPEKTRQHWTAQPGGILQGHSTGDMPGSSHLYYIKKEYRNFEARADICINADGNSGFYFRCPGKENLTKNGWKNWPNGFEFQITNGSGDKKRTGTFYPQPTLWDADMKRLIGFDVNNPVDDLWLHMHIIAVGDYFVCKLNGKVANTHIEPRRSYRKKSGHFAFQMHHKGTKVQFKNLEARELAPDFQPTEDGK